MIITLLAPLVLIAEGLWLWMARANKAGRSWARIMTTVLFGLLTTPGLAWLIAGITGEISLTSGSSLVMAFLVVDWLAGLSAVVLLWQRSSSDYYTATGNRSKTVRAASRKPYGQPAVPPPKR